MISANFPRVWLSLTMPPEREAVGGLVECAIASKAPLDISSSPALWGGHMRGTNATLMLLGTTAIETAVDEDHAGDLTQAHIIASLVAVGREHLDFYFLRVREQTAPHQFRGALRTMSAAQEEGHLKTLGVSLEASPAHLRQELQDSFAIALAETDIQDLDLPVLRRGIRRAEGHWLVTVRSEAEILASTTVIA